MKKAERNKFNLVDYKGKFQIACDEVDEDWDVKVGEISRKDLIFGLESRVESAMYYGVPAYIGEDGEINDLIRKYILLYEKK